MFFMQWKLSPRSLPRLSQRRDDARRHDSAHLLDHVSARDPALADFHRRLSVRRRRSSCAADAGPSPLNFSATVERFGKMLGTGLLVYFSLFLLVLIPLTAMIALLSAGLSIISLFLYLLVGAFMVYMNARLFINFLFWEQTAAFGDDGALLAVRGKQRTRTLCPRRTENGSSSLSRRYRRVALVALSPLRRKSPCSSIYSRKAQRCGKSRTSDGAHASAFPGETPDALMIASDIASAVMNLILAAAPRRLLHRPLLRRESAARRRDN